MAVALLGFLPLLKSSFFFSNNRVGHAQWAIRLLMAAMGGRIFEWG